MFDFTDKAFVEVKETCPQCKGDGCSLHGYKCGTCDGKGVVSQRVKLADFSALLQRIKDLETG